MRTMIVVGDRITRHAGTVALVLTILAAASVAIAQLGSGAGPMRLEGRWGGMQADKHVIGVITISPDGKETRKFGVTAVQAYEPEVEGMDALRSNSLEPITMLLRGDAAMIRRFMTASPDDKVIALGVYRPDSGDFILTGVTVAAKTGGSSPRSQPST